MSESTLSLHLGGRRIDRFLSYRVDSDLYQAADAFSLETADPGMEINPGMPCELRVNGTLEMTGIIDKVAETGDKNGNSVSIEGRDLMGLLVDSYIEGEFADLQSVTLQALAERLIKTIPYLNRKRLVYQAGLAGSAAERTTEEAFDLGQKTHLDATRTVFETLREAAVSRGVMFFALPDGTMVFGRPKAGGAEDFRLLRLRSGQGNTILSGGRTRDISQRYSQITVLGQQQGSDAIGADEINTAATVNDPEMVIFKPGVFQNDNDTQSPAQHARMLLEKQRMASLQFSYRVQGHAQEGKNWRINRLCRVHDEILRPAANGIFLITGRSFELDKQSGRSTEVRLGLPGVIA
jgi:prophage tail gpP-like protein